jgi:hypothetical protein
LDAAALVPGQADVWLLEAVPPAELDELGTCLASGMLEERGAAVLFRHELAARRRERRRSSAAPADPRVQDEPHGSVTGDNPYHVKIMDAGGLCESPPDQPRSGPVRTST